MLVTLGRNVVIEAQINPAQCFGFFFLNSSFQMISIRSFLILHLAFLLGDMKIESMSVQLSVQLSVESSVEKYTTSQMSESEIVNDIQYRSHAF